MEGACVKIKGSSDFDGAMLKASNLTETGILTTDNPTGVLSGNGSDAAATWGLCNAGDCPKLSGNWFSSSTKEVWTVRTQSDCEFQVATHSRSGGYSALRGHAKWVRSSLVPGRCPCQPQNPRPG